MVNRRRFLQVLSAAPAWAARAAASRPNILLILADDLGYSDPGCYGGEIAPPHIGRLAFRGVRLTQLYSSVRLCPSRAALLTGQYPHPVGMGNIVVGQARQEYPGFTGRLSPTAPFLPATLRDSGYSTLMSGKWHLGDPGPVARGFDEYYGMLHGFDSYWDASKYTRLPAGRASATTAQPFYSTDAITGNALAFLSAARPSAPKP